MCGVLLEKLAWEFSRISAVLCPYHEKREGRPASEWVKSPSVFSPTKAGLYLPKGFGRVKMKHDLFNRLKSKVSILVLFVFSDL